MYVTRHWLQAKGNCRTVKLSLKKPPWKLTWNYFATQFQDNIQYIHTEQKCMILTDDRLQFKIVSKN